MTNACLLSFQQPGKLAMAKVDCDRESECCMFRSTYISIKELATLWSTLLATLSGKMITLVTS